LLLLLHVAVRAEIHHIGDFGRLLLLLDVGLLLLFELLLMKTGLALMVGIRVDVICIAADKHTYVFA